MSKRDKARRRVFWATVIIAVLVCFAGHRIFLVMRKMLDEAADKVEQLEVELRAATDEMEFNKVYLQKWDAISGFMDQPVTKRQTEFTIYLQGLRKDLDFDFRGLGAPVGTGMVEDSEFQVLKYELSFESDLSDLVEFLEMLGESPWLLRIERLDVNRLDRRDHVYLGGDYLMTLPSSRAGMLSVGMTVSIPAVLPPVENAGWEVAP